MCLVQGMLCALLVQDVLGASMPSLCAQWLHGNLPSPRPRARACKELQCASWFLPKSNLFYLLTKNKQTTKKKKQAGLDCSSMEQRGAPTGRCSRASKGREEGNKHLFPGASAFAAAKSSSFPFQG